MECSVVARFCSIIVISPLSPATIQAQAANKGKEEDTTHAILAIYRRPGFVFCAGWYPEGLPGKHAPGGHL
jgi:hypothetical protein